MLPNPVFLAFLVAQLVKIPPAMEETRGRSLGWEDTLEKGKATHSSILAWRSPWIQSMWSQRVRHDWVTFTFFFTFLLKHGSVYHLTSVPTFSIRYSGCLEDNDETFISRLKNTHTVFHPYSFFFHFILLYNTVLVLPYIDMNPPRVYMRSQIWTPLPPPSIIENKGG